MTSNLCTSKQYLRYMALTAYFIYEQLQLQEKIISFSLLEYLYTGARIRRGIIENTREYNIKNKKIPMTLDNACLNNNVIEIIKLVIPLFHIR